MGLNLVHGSVTKQQGVTGLVPTPRDVLKIGPRHSSEAREQIGALPLSVGCIRIVNNIDFVSRHKVART